LTRHLIGVFAFEQLRNPAREFDDLHAASDLTRRVGNDFAVLAGNDLGKLARVLEHEIAKSKHHPRATRRRRVAPVEERLARGLNGGVDIGRLGK
jgi:hypothetical protein